MRSVEKIPEFSFAGTVAKRSTPAAAPSKAELEFDLALARVYRDYGPDLSKFFAAVRQSELERTDGQPILDLPGTTGKR